MKKTTIFKALMALLVIMLGINFNADAQIGDLIRASKNLSKQNKAKKENQAAAELEDIIEWKNTSAENEVMEYESSRPYAGFDREKYPHLRNCKVAAVGFMSD